MIRVTQKDNSNVELSFLYNEDYVRIIKTLPRRTYSSRDKVWRVPTMDKEKVKALFLKYKIPFRYFDARKKEMKSFELMRPKLKLFPEQEECVQFALNKGSIINNSEIGQGKTASALITAITLKKERDYQKILIIVPSSLKRQWCEEIEKFTSQNFNLVEGTKKKRIYRSNAFFTVVGYESARNDIEKIKEVNWDLLILDEIVRIKNHKTKLAKTMKQIPCKIKMGLTGAILENRIQELFNILNFIRPKTFFSYWDFASRFFIREYINRPWGTYWEIKGFRNIGYLREIMGDFVIKKKLTDLPEKREKTYKVPMTKEQRNYYQQILDECIEEIEVNENPLAKLTALRQVCNAPETVGLEGKSNKIEELKNILKEIGHQKVVIFSQFKKFAELIFKALEKIEVPSVLVHGGMSSLQKDQLIKLWKVVREGHACILVTTDCLSYGMNLQEASILINADLLWNPVKMQQRVGRIWRRGQKKGCLIINIISEDSVEEAVMEILNQKISMINEILNEDIDRFKISRKEELLGILKAKKVYNISKKGGEKGEMQTLQATFKES